MNQRLLNKRPVRQGPNFQAGVKATYPKKRCPAGKVKPQPQSLCITVICFPELLKNSLSMFFLRMSFAEGAYLDGGQAVDALANPD